MNKITSNKLPAPTQSWIWNCQSTYLWHVPFVYIHFSIKDSKKWKKMTAIFKKAFQKTERARSIKSDLLAKTATKERISRHLNTMLWECTNMAIKRYVGSQINWRNDLGDFTSTSLKLTQIWVIFLMKSSSRAPGVLWWEEVMFWAH